MALKLALTRTLVASVTALAVVTTPLLVGSAQADTYHAPVPETPATPYTDDGSDSYKVTAQDAADAGMSIAELQTLYDQETAGLDEDDAAFDADLKKSGVTAAQAQSEADAAVPVLSQAERDADQSLEDATDLTDSDETAVEDSAFVGSGSSSGTGAGLNGGTKPVKITTTTPIVRPPIDKTTTGASPDGGCSGCGGGGGGGGSWGGYKCTPKSGDYCWHNTKYMLYGRKALAYANSHTKRAERFPVPFPTTYGGSLRNRHHTIYVVRYYDRQNHAHTWKFGITSLKNYAVRARVGKQKCNAQIGTWRNGTLNSKANSCHYTWVGVTTDTDGWRYGRYLEASLILWYSRKGGGNIPPRSHVCPPGQRWSCR